MSNYCKTCNIYYLSNECPVYENKNFNVFKICEDVYHCSNILYILGISNLSKKSKTILSNICSKIEGEIMSPLIIKYIREQLSESSEFNGSIITTYNDGRFRRFIIQFPL